MRRLEFCSTHAESVSAVLEEDVPDPSVLVEEPLYVPRLDVVGQVAQEDPCAVARGHHWIGEAADG